MHSSSSWLLDQTGRVGPVPQRFYCNLVKRESSSTDCHWAISIQVLISPVSLVNVDDKTFNFPSVMKEHE